MAAGGAWKSAKETRKTSLAQILMQITDAYGTDEMLESMKTLRSHKENRERSKKDFATEFAFNWEFHYDQVKDLDKHRRRLSHHFHKIILLFDTGFVDESFVKKVVTRAQVDFLFEIIEPLDRAIESSYKPATFGILRKIIPEKPKGGTP
jgi:hypothetical protein